MNTDLNEVKNVAIALLYIPIEETAYSPIVVQHPYFESAFYSLCLDEKQEIVNLLEDDKKTEIVLSQIKQRIESSENIFKIYHMIRKSYRLSFLKLVTPYLSINDMSEILSDAWVSSEAPNKDVNCSHAFLISLFKKSNKEILMGKDNYLYFCKLPNTITLYRGVGSHKNEKGLSWTRNLETAKWFATRFDNSQGYVISTKVPKEDVLAYFNDRNEDEYIIDYRKVVFDKI